MVKKKYVLIKNQNEFVIKQIYKCLKKYDILWFLKSNMSIEVILNKFKQNQIANFAFKICNDNCH